jgi:hypothetical protein
MKFLVLFELVLSILNVSSVMAIGEERANVVFGRDFSSAHHRS